MESNKLMALNNHLFEQMERLNDDELSVEELDKEVVRTKSMVDLSNKIIDNAKISLDATKLRVEYSNSIINLPEMIE